MAVTIDNAYVVTFESNVRHLSQQKYSKLRPYVMIRGEESKEHNWEIIGPGPVNDVSGATDGPMTKTGRQVDTPLKDSPWSRRVSQPSVKHTAESIEQEDPTQMLVDPTSAVTTNIAMTMNRGVDDIIIAAALGNALDEDGGSNALPAGQVIGDGSADISLDNVTEVEKRFLEADVSEDEKKIMVIGPYQWKVLMNLAQVTSSDYQFQKALATGVMPNWMGFDWIISTRLEIPSATQMNCFAFTTRAIGLNINKDIWTRVAEDPTRSFMWIAYAAMQMGAVRVEDAHIIKLHVKNDV